MPFSPFKIEDPHILVSLVLGFVLIVLMLVKLNIPYLSLPYFRQILGERATRIEENHNQIAKELAEIKHLRDDYASRLQQIEAETRVRLDAAVKEAESARSEIVAEAQAAAVAVGRRAEEELARERTRQRIQLRQEIVRIALDSAEEAVKANSGEKVQHLLINDFITRAASAPQTV